MKQFLLTICLFLTISTCYSQSKEELAKEQLKRNIEGPLPKLNGTWVLSSIAMGNQTFYSEKISTHIKDAYKETLANAKQPLTAADSSKTYTYIENLLKSTLLKKYHFHSRLYSIDINGKDERGSVHFSDDRSIITLYLDSKSEVTKTLRIDYLDESKLVLVPIQESAELGKPSRELGKLVFYKQEK